MRHEEDAEVPEKQQPVEASAEVEATESGTEAIIQDGEVEGGKDGAEVSAVKAMERAVEEVEAEAELVNKEVTLETIPTGKPFINQLIKLVLRAAPMNFSSWSPGRNTQKTMTFDLCNRNCPLHPMDSSFRSGHCCSVNLCIIKYVPVRQ